MAKNLDATYKVLQGDYLEYLKKGSVKDVHLTFFDPPFNQGKDYEYFDDEQDPEKYWSWIKEILKGIYEATVKGGAFYFMQREKNTNIFLIL